MHQTLTQAGADFKFWFLKIFAQLEVSSLSLSLLLLFLLFLRLSGHQDYIVMRQQQPKQVFKIASSSKIEKTNELRDLRRPSLFQFGFQQLVIFDICFFCICRLFSIFKFKYFLIFREVTLPQNYQSNSTIYLLRLSYHILA